MEHPACLAVSITDAAISRKPRNRRENSMISRIALRAALAGAVVMFASYNAAGVAVAQQQLAAYSDETAIRYGIGVGRIGFQWSGVERVSQKQEWPDWHVPPEMIGRQPYLPRFMAGGPGNPLGARALYLGHTEFRIHGTNQPDTIGHAVSSGCIRLDNADVIDLYNRVQVGAKVVVKQSASASNKRSSGA